jgi:hypothetical protein
MPRLLRFLILSCAVLGLLGAVGERAKADPATPAATPNMHGWQQIVLSGDTQCSRGTPYSFFFRPAPVTAQKLMIFFEGGGACWNALTCIKGSPYFKDAISPNELDSYNKGVFDLNNPENPAADYDAVLIPYCTGDVHVGDSTSNYKLTDYTLTIHHNGYKNVTAVLAWIYAHYTAPQQIFIAGVSAGAYGAITYADTIITHYPNAQIVQIGDAGVGVTAHNWGGLADWGFFDVIKQVRPDLSQAGPGAFNINMLYTTSLKRSPNVIFSEYTSANDKTQTTFYQLMGGSDWPGGMEAMLKELDAYPNFRSFVAGGDVHTVLSRPEFYTYSANGVRVRDWLANLLTGKLDQVTNVHCTLCDQAGQ